jgi:hypothetical protein
MHEEFQIRNGRGGAGELLMNKRLQAGMCRLAIFEDMEKRRKRL